MKTGVKVSMKTIGQLLRDKGLDIHGDVQRFHTQNVLRRIVRYMPYRSGMTIKQTVVQTDIAKPEIVTDAPYGQYIYHGKVMIDPAIHAAGFLTPEGWRSRKGSVKVATTRPLDYTKTQNSRAGPYWDRRLWANEGKVISAELQRYLDRRRGL